MNSALSKIMKAKKFTPLQAKFVVDMLGSESTEDNLVIEIKDVLDILAMGEKIGFVTVNNFAELQEKKHIFNAIHGAIVNFEVAEECSWIELAEWLDVIHMMAVEKSCVIFGTTRGKMHSLPVMHVLYVKE
jgi:hypothetical protein